MRTIISVPVYLLFLFIFLRITNGSNDGAPNGELVLQSFTMPINDGPLSDLSVIVDVSGFATCQKTECAIACSSKDPKHAYCNTVNKRLCMCSVDNFYASDLEGTVISVDRSNALHKNCSVACNKRMSYARIWTKTDKTLECICLMNQITTTGITLCDEFAVVDVCKAVCQSDLAQCTFTGACLCRKNWGSAFNLELPNIRKEEPQDALQCSNICSSYHHDYLPRIYDAKLHSGNKTYGFRDKYCICGPEYDLMTLPPSIAIVKQGFQLCSGLKCKRSCGMDEAICEPKYRRACLCNREGIIIGDHLWSRLPGKGEVRCQETCYKNGLDARVIEFNPFMDRENQVLGPFYRRSEYPYFYAGKHCHCIQVQMDMHQYRPCTDELCKLICGHNEAICDKRTRRSCFCYTHQLPHAVGRLADPAEKNCNIACRFGLFDARILDVKWEVPVDKWGVKVSKYCMCVRAVSPAGITHCDPVHDVCPIYCGKPTAYCTRDKYCHCGRIPDIMKNPMIRLGNGMEQEECGERCRSWMWPLAEDVDNKPYIFDESLGDCQEDSSCPKVDSSPWKPNDPSKGSAVLDALEDLGSIGDRKYCLCAKSHSVTHSPGSRFQMHMEPVRGLKGIPCATNHTCAIVGSAIHIIT